MAEQFFRHYMHFMCVFTIRCSGTEEAQEAGLDGRHGTARRAGRSESAQGVQQAPQFLGGKLTEPGIDIAFSPLEEYPAG